jgi:hypothetical protein
MCLHFKTPFKLLSCQIRSISTKKKKRYQSKHQAQKGPQQKGIKRTQTKEQSPNISDINFGITHTEPPLREPRTKPALPSHHTTFLVLRFSALYPHLCKRSRSFPKFSRYNLIMDRRCPTTATSRRLRHVRDIPNRNGRRPPSHPTTTRRRRSLRQRIASRIGQCDRYAMLRLQLLLWEVGSRYRTVRRSTLGEETRTCVRRSPYRGSLRVIPSLPSTWCTGT